MTFESSGRGRPPGQPATHPDLTAEIHTVLEKMHDSVVGLRKAAGLVSDDALTRYLAGMAERREDAVAALVTAASEAGIEPVGKRSGTMIETLRRGWMSLEASIDGDERVVGTVIDQERSMLEEIEHAMALELPAGVERRLRTIAGGLGSDITGLSEWRRTDHVEGDER